MFASVSHELRTPLNAIVNSHHLARITLNELKTKLSEMWVFQQVKTIFGQVEKFLKISDVSSKLLLILIEDILDLAKFTSQTFSLNVSKFTLMELVNEIKYMYEFQWIDKKIKFVINYEHGMLDHVLCSDSRRIKQVLINLISNSFKFTEKGYIKIKIENYKRVDNSYIKFTVTDTGIGISKSDINNLFKMFSMLSKNWPQINQFGSGIGLSISK